MIEVLEILRREKEIAEEGYKKSLELNRDVIESGKRAEREVQRHAEKSRQISEAIETLDSKIERLPEA